MIEVSAATIVDGYEVSGTLEAKQSAEIRPTQAGILRAILVAYGYRQAELDQNLQRRFMAYTILHRYSRLSWYLSLMPPKEGVITLDDLAGQWWSFG